MIFGIFGKFWIDIEKIQIEKKHFFIEKKHFEKIHQKHRKCLRVFPNILRFCKGFLIRKPLQNLKMLGENSGGGGTVFLFFQNFFLNEKILKKSIWIFSISIQNFPKIPKIILRTACDYSKDAKNSKTQGRISYLVDFQWFIVSFTWRCPPLTLCLPAIALCLPAIGLLITVCSMVRFWYYYHARNFKQPVLQDY